MKATRYIKSTLLPITTKLLSATAIVFAGSLALSPVRVTLDSPVVANPDSPVAVSLSDSENSFAVPPIEEAPAAVAVDLDLLRAMAAAHVEKKSIVRPIRKIAKVRKHAAPKPKVVARILKKVRAVKPPLPSSIRETAEASAKQVIGAFALLAEATVDAPTLSRLEQLRDKNKLESELESLVETGLSEPPLLWDASVTFLTSLPPAGEAEPVVEPVVVELVERNAVIFAEFEHADFSEIRQHLALLNSEAQRNILSPLPLLLSNQPVVPAPTEPENARPSVAASAELAPATSAPLASASDLPEALNGDQLSKEIVWEENGADSSASDLHGIVSMATAVEPAAEPAATAEPRLVKPVPDPELAQPSVSVWIARALSAVTPVTTQKAVDSQKVLDTFTSTQPVHLAQVARSTRSTRELLRGDQRSPHDGEIDGIDQSEVARANGDSDAETVFGVFSADATLDRKLAESKGHVELHLVPLDRSDTTVRDNKRVDYVYSPGNKNDENDEFSIPAGTLHGAYRLYARVFLRDSVASIPYKTPVTQLTRERIRFHITQKMYDSYFEYYAKVPKDDLVLNVTVFAGGQGDPKKPERIKNARVRVKLPGWQTHYSDKDGNVRIPNVPAHSELLITIAAEGYLSTERVVPVFATDQPVVISMVPQETVQSITHYFTKSPQASDKSVVMGRVFDPISRKFLKGEELTLQYRNGPAVYMDVFPDLSLVSTVSTGLFGFFNITPSIRSVFRKTFGKWGYLLNIRPGSGYFVDIGRDGQRDLKIRLFDTLNGVRPEATLRVVGQENTAVETHGDGAATFKDVDLPAGIFTVEVESPGYPRFMYSIPFDVQDSHGESRLFLQDEKFFKEGHQDFAKISQLDRSKGSVIGGAEPSLFAATSSGQCVSVELMTAEEQLVDKSHGPFPWGRAGDSQNGLCLNASNPRYAFYNLPPGQYISRLADSKGKNLRAHVFFVGKNRPTMVIN